jgi:hypothetical protein
MDTDDDDDDADGDDEEAAVAAAAAAASRAKASPSSSLKAAATPFLEPRSTGWRRTVDPRGRREEESDQHVPRRHRLVVSDSKTDASLVDLAGCSSAVSHGGGSTRPGSPSGRPSLTISTATDDDLPRLDAVGSNLDVGRRLSASCSIPSSDLQACSSLGVRCACGSPPFTCCHARSDSRSRCPRIGQEARSAP